MNQHHLARNQPDDPDGYSRDPDDADPDDPTCRPEWEHLRPERIRIGSIGVFAGDWAWTPAADGAMRIPVAFVGTLIDRWNGWAVFACTREVAQAIVADQQAQREQLRRDLTEQGVPAQDLDRRVDEAMATLTFDGDTIVADQRVLSEDPQAIERIGPRPDGRYVVMGWNWCWEAVHPSYCDRIVGDLPTPAQQQEFVELVHTEGMQLPHDRLRIEFREQSLTLLGLRLAGTLTLDGQPVGAINDDGYGGGARLDPTDSPALTAYLERCLHRGHPVTLQRLLDALVDEHYLNALITRAHAYGQTVLRLVDQDGHTLSASPTDPPPNWAARQALAAAMRREAGELVGQWQLWDRTRWTYLTRVGDQPTPPASAGQP